MTGKLSDFAGLFFFSILLGAVLNIVLSSFRLKQEQTAFFAFGFTAIWFTLMKIMPFFNSLTENILSRILFQNIQIVLDPTDLIALVMLLPAWRLRDQVSMYPIEIRKKVSYAVLGLGLLASLASSSPPAEIGIRHFIVYENGIYADVTVDNDYQDVEFMSYSLNGGVTWTYARNSDLPDEVLERRGAFPELPVTVCIPNDPDECYRTEKEKILVSNDGGTTWEIDWEIPLGRKEFMLRYERPAPDKSKLNVGPYDLIVFQYENEYILLAAAGEEGVLVKKSGSVWERHSVLNASPTPYQADSLIIAFVTVFNEIIVGIGATLMFLFLYVFIHAKTYKSKSIMLFWCFIAVLLILSALVFKGLTAILLMSIQIFFIFLLIIIVLMIREAVINTISPTNTGFVIRLIFLLVSPALFLLWSSGFIPVYEIALITVIVIFLSFFMWLVYRLVMRVRKQPLI